MFFFLRSKTTILYELENPLLTGDTIFYRNNVPRFDLPMPNLAGADFFNYLIFIKARKKRLLEKTHLKLLTSRTPKIKFILASTK